MILISTSNHVCKGLCNNAVFEDIATIRPADMGTSIFYPKDHFTVCNAHIRATPTSNVAVLHTLC